MNAARCRGCNERLHATHQPGCELGDHATAVTLAETDAYLDNDPGPIERPRLELDVIVDPDTGQTVGTIPANEPLTFDL